MELENVTASQILSFPKLSRSWKMDLESFGKERISKMSVENLKYKHNPSKNYKIYGQK